MEIFQPPDGSRGEFDNSNTLTRLGASMQDGVITIHRKLWFVATKEGDDASDIVNLPCFPQKGSAYHKNPSFTFTGNATIEPLSETSKYWYADLEYSKGSTGGSSVSGGNGETKPWNLPPENLSFTYPEVTMPFTTAYDKKGERKVPVLNMAGDPIVATHSVRNMQMSFSYNKRNVGNAVFEGYCGSINKNSIKVCGVNIPAERAVLQGLEYNLMHTYDDNGKLKWEYWQITCTLLIDVTNRCIKREFLNVGNRAFFKQLDVYNKPVIKEARLQGYAPYSTTLPATKTKKPSTIVSFREPRLSSDKKVINQVGDVVFCSWEQFCELYRMYREAGEKLGIKGFYLQYEQESNVPLTKEGYVDLEAYETKNYITVIYRQYPLKSWSSLDLPKKL